MLVDSHCHLDFPDFAAELDAVVGAPAAAGVGRMVTISTRVKTPCAGPGDRRAVSGSFLLGRDASQPRARRTGRRCQALIAVAKHPKVVAIGEAGLDYFRNTSPREAQAAGLPPAYCRGSGNRAAAGDPLARLRCGYGADLEGREREGRLPGDPALLYRRARPRLHGLELGHYVSFSGILTFKNADGCVRSRPPCRRIASWWRRMRPISRRCRIAENVTSLHT